MTYDPDRRLLFSPRIMPFLCLYPRVLSLPGGYLFFSILCPGCLAFPKTQSLPTADKKRERKVNPPTDWVYHPPSSPFVLCLLYTIPPHTPSLPAVVPHRLHPYPPTSLCSTGRTGQKAKKHLKKVPYHVSICTYPAHAQSTYDHHMQNVSNYIHIYIYI